MFKVIKWIVIVLFFTLVGTYCLYMMQGDHKGDVRVEVVDSVTGDHLDQSTAKLWSNSTQKYDQNMLGSSTFVFVANVGVPAYLEVHAIGYKTVREVVWLQENKVITVQMTQEKTGTPK